MLYIFTYNRLYNITGNVLDCKSCNTGSNPVLALENFTKINFYKNEISYNNFKNS